MRRQLLKSGLLAGIAAPFISVCNCGVSRAFAAEESPASITTLKRSIAPGDPLVKGKPYRALASDSGWPILVREELCAARSGRESRRRALASFAHITDLHIIDAASPSHLTFMRQYKGTAAGAPLSNAARAQDTLTVHVLDAMVRRINAVAKGPISGRPFDFAISTGDNADTRGFHELQSVISVLNGEAASFNAAGGLYQGLQDSAPGSGVSYDAFWHPEPVGGGQDEDSWKRLYGYPSVDGFIEAVSKSVTSQGLAFPWYTAFGNHDQMDLGVMPVGGGLSNFMEILATGNKMPTSLPSGMTPDDFIGALLKASDEASMNAILAEMPTRDIRASAGRRTFTKQEFIRMHLEQKGPIGPEGHGFTQENLRQKTAYYRFDMADGLVGLMLDTTNPNGGPDGSLDADHVAWLTKELESLHARHYAEDGSIVTTGNKDNLVVLFSHHNSRTLDNLTRAPGENQSDRIGSDKILALFARFPNIVLWVNGHTHCNRIWFHPDPNDAGGGIWEVNTAAHIDYPQQARTIEIVDNNDGTLSVFTVVIDHSDPEVIRRVGIQDQASLAALSLELALNDPDLDRPYRLGLPEDLNVELILKNPLS
ncbi:MAG: TIGR03767 family metallophosphoesterase [Phyllobacterium sp.]